MMNKVKGRLGQSAPHARLAIPSTRKAVFVDPAALKQIRVRMSNALKNQAQRVVPVALTRSKRFEQWMTSHPRLVTVVLTVGTPAWVLLNCPSILQSSDWWAVVLLTACMPRIAKWLCAGPSELGESVEALPAPH